MIRSPLSWIAACVIATTSAAAAERTHALPTDCGSGPALAKAFVAGTLYGRQLNGPDGSYWDEFVTVDSARITPVTVAEECRRVMSAPSLTGAGADTLPMLGIVRVGDAGYFVVQGTPPSGPGGHGTFAYSILAPDLALRARHRFTY